MEITTQTLDRNDGGASPAIARVLDAFALSGMLGLPAPTERLSALDDLRAKQSAEEASLLEERLRGLKDDASDTENIRDSARRQLEAIPAALTSLEAQEIELTRRETDAVRRRSSASSSLAARRASYPHRLAIEKERVFSDLSQRIIERERSVTEALAAEPHARAAAEQSRTKAADREGLLESARAKCRAADKAVEDADKRLRAFEAIGLNRATSGFLTFTGLSALLIIGTVLGVQLSGLPGRPLDLISSVLAITATGLTGPIRQLGVLKGALILVGSWAAVTMLMWLTLWIGDLLLGRLVSNWNTSSHAARDRLPGLWAGGDGRVVTRQSIHQRLARLPFLAAACLPALLFLLLAGWDTQFAAAITATTFWTSVTGALLGIAIVAVSGCLAVVWVAPRLATMEGDRVAFGVRRWWPAWTGLAFSLAAVPVPGTTALAPLTYLGQLGWLAGGSVAFAIGLVMSANRRTCNLLKAQARSAERELAGILRNGTEPTAGRLEAELSRAREAVEAHLSGTLATKADGTLSFMRPTRRFFNTPQANDDLDKATLEEYTGADALFEPALLTQLFDVSAELQQLRAELVSLRDKRQAVTTERSQLQQSLENSNARMQQLLHERSRLVHDFSRNEENRVLQDVEYHSNTAAAAKMGNLFRAATSVKGDHNVTA